MGRGRPLRPTPSLRRPGIAGAYMIPGAIFCLLAAAAAVVHGGRRVAVEFCFLHYVSIVSAPLWWNVFWDQLLLLFD